MAKRMKKVESALVLEDLLQKIDTGCEKVSTSIATAEELMKLIDEWVKILINSKDKLVRHKASVISLLGQDSIPANVLRSLEKLTSFFVEKSEALTEARLVTLVRVAVERTSKSPVEKRKSVMEASHKEPPGRQKPASKKSRKKKSSKRKAAKPYGIYAYTGKMFEKAFGPEVNYPETLEAFLQLNFGDGWKDHVFHGYIPGLHGQQHRRLEEDVANSDSMLKRALASGYKALMRYEHGERKNALPGLKNLYERITIKHNMVGIKLVLVNKWGVNVE